MEAHLRELRALKRYKEADRLKEEVGHLKTRLSELQAENGRLKKELLLNMNAKQEANQLREALKQA
jgi:predicted nuclease with TOPRIM domain